MNPDINVNSAMYTQSYYKFTIENPYYKGFTHHGTSQVRIIATPQYWN